MSRGLVDRLQLRVREHPCPYFVRCLMIGDQVQVRHRCHVAFTIGKDLQGQCLGQCSVNECKECRPWKAEDV